MGLFTELKRRNVVRVGVAYLASAWLLVQIAETVFPIFGLEPTLIKPFIIVLIIGFPLALVFSWAYELTPEGLKLDQDVDRSASITRTTGKKLDRAIIVVLTIAIAYFAVDKFLLDPVRDSQRDTSVAQQARSDVLLEQFGEVSIAVMPFVNMSDDASDEYFADGLSQDLLNLLTRIAGVRVIAHSTMIQFKGKDIDIGSVAEQLDVSHLLEGSVRRAGNRIRVTAQLIDAQTETLLWSDIYDRELDDIFQVQDEISTSIATSMQDDLQVRGVPQALDVPSSSIEAYESFLRGRHFIAQRSRDSMALAVEELENAVSLDPDFAAAHAQLAIAYRLQLSNLHGDLTRDQANGLAEPHAERALSIDPDLAIAHAALGFVRWTQDRDDEARTHFEDAIRLNPSLSDVYVWLATELGGQGSYAEQFTMRQLNVRIDPLSIPARGNLIISLVQRHEFEEARRQMQQLEHLSEAQFFHAKSRLDLVESGWAAGLFGYLNQYRYDFGKQWVRGRIMRLLVAIGLEEEAIALMDPPDFFRLSLVGRSADAIALSKANADANGTEEWDWGMGFSLAAAGNYVEALPWLQHNWGTLFDGKVLTYGGGITVWDATALIQARLASGVDDGIHPILTAMEAEVQRLRSGGVIGEGPFLSTDFNAALVSLQSGEREQGLEHLEVAVDQGYYIPTHFEFLRFMFDDSAFPRVLAKQEANRLRERNKFLSVVCTDNPYSDVWLPLPSTCSGFEAVTVN